MKRRLLRGRALTQSGCSSLRLSSPAVWEVEIIARAQKTSWPMGRKPCTEEEKQQSGRRGRGQLGDGYTDLVCIRADSTVQETEMP